MNNLGGTFPVDNNSPLNRVREGMDVLDSRGKKIGTVEAVQFGDEDPTSPEVNTVTGSNLSDNSDSLVENLAAAVFGDDNIPETLRARMIRYGYIRIDRGLLSSDVYALGDQIGGVSGDEVHLNVQDDALVAR